MLGRSVLPVVEEIGLKALLAPIRELIAGRHVVANLESPLSKSCSHLDDRGSPILRAPVRMALQLREAGVSAVSLANNHVFDCGIKGLGETIQALDGLGIGHTGAGMDLDSAIKAATIATDCYKIGIVSFSYLHPARKGDPGVAYIYDDTVDTAISVARKEVDFLIAMPHAGIVLFQYPMSRDQRVYRKMVDLGADLVVGGHPHCVQAMEIYKGKFVFYSLGDCIFDNHDDATWMRRWADSSPERRYGVTGSPSLSRQSLMVMVDFLEGQMKVSYAPLVMRDLPGPQPMIGEEKRQWLSRFEDICSRLLSDQTIRKRREEIEEKLMKSLRKRGLL